MGASGSLQATVCYTKASQIKPLQMTRVTSVVFVTVFLASWRAAVAKGGLHAFQGVDYFNSQGPPQHYQHHHHHPVAQEQLPQDQWEPIDSLRGLDWTKKGFGYHTRKFRSPHRRVNRIRDGRSVKSHMYAGGSLLLPVGDQSVD